MGGRHTPPALLLHRVSLRTRGVEAADAAVAVGAAFFVLSVLLFFLLLLLLLQVAVAAAVSAAAAAAAVAAAAAGAAAAAAAAAKPNLHHGDGWFARPSVPYSIFGQSKTYDSKAGWLLLALLLLLLQLLLLLLLQSRTFPTGTGGSHEPPVPH